MSRGMQFLLSTRRSNGSRAKINILDLIPHLVMHGMNSKISFEIVQCARLLKMKHDHSPIVS